MTAAPDIQPTLFETQSSPDGRFAEVADIPVRRRLDIGHHDLARSRVAISVSTIAVDFDALEDPSDAGVHFTIWIGVDELREFADFVRDLQTSGQKRLNGWECGRFTVCIYPERSDVRIWYQGADSHTYFGGLSSAFMNKIFDFIDKLDKENKK